MEGKRVLVVSSEASPYMEGSMSSASLEVVDWLVQEGAQVRICIPKYGLINERKHQLHEVARLSKGGVLVDKINFPLIVKVATIPNRREQVYFIGNDELFKRSDLYLDEEGQLFDDTDIRLIFFAKGVLELIKGFNWIPDYIHFHGWMTYLVPLFLRDQGGKLLKDTRVITSLFNFSEGQSSEGKELADKLKKDKIDEKHLKVFEKGLLDGALQLAIRFSDEVVQVGPPVGSLESLAKEEKKTVQAAFASADELIACYLGK